MKNKTNTFGDDLYSLYLDFIDDFIWSLKLYSLVTTIPAALTILNILFFGILGFDSKFGFMMNFKIIWIDYFFTGYMMDIIAWKWHLGLLFLSYTFTKLQKI